MSNQRRAGVVLSYAGQAVQILTGLIYTPIMLRILGQGEYGLYQLVNSVVSYLGLLSLGFNASYMRFYSREKVNGNETGIARLNGMFMLIFCAISLICIACGAIMVHNITNIFGNGLTAAEYPKARVLMTMMVVNLALSFPNSVFSCIVTSRERFVFQKLLIFFQALLNPFLSLPLLLLGYGSVGLVVVSTLLTVSVLTTNAYYCVRKLNARFCFTGLHFGLLQEMWVFTFFIFLNQIIDQVNWSVDKYLLGRLSGTVAVAVYSVGGQINSMYLQFSLSVSNVFVPQVNQIVAESNDAKRLTDIFIKVGRVQFIILSLVMSGFIFFGKPFIALWTGSGYSESYYVALLLMIPGTIPLMQNIGIEIQRAQNKHKTRSLVYFFIAIANVLLSIPLIARYGPIGAAIGTAISLVIGNGFFMNWYYRVKISIDIPKFWKSMLPFLPTLLIASVVGVLSFVLFEYRSWISLGAGIVVYCAVFAASLYLTGLDKEEKQMIHRFLRKLKPSV